MGNILTIIWNFFLSLFGLGRNFAGVQECGILFEETATSSRGCEEFMETVVALGEGTLPREDFGQFFDSLVPDIETYVQQGVPPDFDMNTLTIDFNMVRERLAGFIYDGQTLMESDFNRLVEYDGFPQPRAGQNRTRMLGETDVDNKSKRIHVNHLVQQKNTPRPSSSLTTALANSTLAMELSHLHRGLQGDGLSADCIDAIISFVLETIGLVLATAGVGQSAAQAFDDLFLRLQADYLDIIVLMAYRQSGGSFDTGFFVGLVTSFLSTIEWQDISIALSTIDRDDWISLATGLTLSVAGTLATGGLAIALAVSGFLMQAENFGDAFRALDECLALCDEFTQSGGQQTTTYLVGLDRSRGTLQLFYEMYRIPDRLDMFYENNMVFTTGGLVSGSRTVLVDIDGEELEVAVRITAPNSGTAWDFRVSCPSP